MTCDLQLSQSWVHDDQLHRRGRDIKHLNVTIVAQLRIALVLQFPCPEPVPKTRKPLKLVAMGVKKQRGIGHEVDLESADEASVPGEGLIAFWSSARDIDEPDFAPHVRAEERVPTSVDLAAGLDVLGRQEAGDQIYDEWDIEDDEFLWHGVEWSGW